MPEEISEQPPKIPPPTETRLEREGNVTHIYEPEGTWTIIYGPHTFFSYDPKQLPKGTDGLFLEHQSNYLKNPLGFLSADKESKDYQPLIEFAETNRVPVYFADLDIRNEMLVIPAEVLVELTETVVGAAILKKIPQVMRNNRMSRRQFLKIGARALSGAWLMTPMASMVGTTASGLTGAEEERTAEFIKLSDRMHPEDILISKTLRNVVLAHKEEWLMNKMGNKPHFSTIFGPLHAGLEDQIQHSPESRIEFVRALRPVLKTVVTPETLYKMIRFDFDGKNWRIGEIFEVPELKELVT